MLLLAFIYAGFIDYWYINPKEENYEDYVVYPRMYNMFVILSFWSVHTNVLVVLWFLYALFYHNKEEKNKFTNSKTQLNITVYITLTFLLFWGWITYPFDERKTSEFVLTLLTHLVKPLLMIIYYPLSNCKKLISYITFFIKDVAIMYIYPVIYCLYSYMRAEMVVADGIEPFVYVYWYSWF